MYNFSLMKWLSGLLLIVGLATGSTNAAVTTQTSDLSDVQADVQKNYPIVYLVATPCSGMVELLRMMHERGDMTVMHIPANLAYCHVHNYVDIVRGWYREGAPVNYQQAVAEIDKMALTAPVVVGENTHTAVEFLAENQEFANRPEVHYVFLIADPHSIIISYYEKKKEYFDQLPKEQITNSVGFKELYAFITSLKDKENGVFICQSEDLYYRSETTVQSLCNYLHIPYLPKALHWKDLSHNFSTFPFWTIENTSCSYTWHLDAIKSTRFTQPQQYATDSYGNPTFEEIIDENHRKICVDAYKENKVYYDLIMNMTPAH